MNAVLHFISLFFAGLLAGMEMAIHYGIVQLPGFLNEETQIRLRQELVRRLRVLVPAVFLPTAIFAVALSVVDAAKPGSMFRYAALFGLFVWVFPRVVRTVGLTSASLNWDPARPPANWLEAVAEAEQFHNFGVWAAALAFACLLAATVQ